MRNFFQNFAGRFADAPNPHPATISGYLTGGGDIFDRQAFRKFLNNSSKTNELDKIQWRSPTELLPIEFFKRQDLLPHFCTKEHRNLRTFRSSGTTQSTQSESPFSELGLALYQACALQGFDATLRRLFPGFADPWAIHGYSLIPGSDIWPTSSLAQMISWFAQESKVTFLTDEDSENCRRTLQAAEGPVWLFGTAFHFVNLLDNGFRCPLPPGSIVVETGGTKGRSRTVTRAELFAMIAHGFALPARRIISEYSMSELATQSWDFGQDSTDARYYQFPAWVRTGVLTVDGALREKGTGALVIDDPLRIDLPHPLRTEDIVRLDGDSFQILRRSTAAPLKGCSLLAEKIPATGAIQIAESIQTHVRDHALPIQRAEKLRSLYLALLDDPEVIAAFATEFEADLFATQAAEDLRNSLDLTPKQLVAAAARSGAHADQRWTIIAPNNHSLAAVHPVILAFVAGMDIAVRIPEKFFAPTSFLYRLLTGLNVLRPGFATFLPHDLRITEKKDIWCDSNVLVFGSDETINQLSSVARGRISGFGDTVAVSVGSLRDVEDHADKITRDFLTLRQSGCMSPRLFILDARSDEDGRKAASVLAKSAEKYRKAMSVDDAAAVHGETVRYATQFKSSKKSSDLPLVIALAQHQATDLSACIAQKAFVIPLLISQSPDASAFVNNLKSLVLPELNIGLMLSATADAYCETLAESIKSSGRFLSFRSFGSAQCPLFSGSHEGRPLFQISC